MGTCSRCGRESRAVAQEIGICVDCLRDGELKRENGGPTCGECGNHCTIPPHKRGRCGLRVNTGDGITSRLPSSEHGVASLAYEALPTNCVAGWVCPPGTGDGYPEYLRHPRSERGFKNLAVFLGACSFDCMFCQNAHYAEMADNLKPLLTTGELAGRVSDDVACICFYGGDPSPQFSFTIKAAERAVARREGVLRICWETNGTMREGDLDRATQIAIKSGGCLKFDLKAWNENLHVALTGASNRTTLQNFARAASHFDRRPIPPPVVASTPLVTGYVDEREVAALAGFIADCEPRVPYKLLAFGPAHMLYDLPPTPRRQAEECRRVALEAGLENVKIGNTHLLR